MTTRPNAVAMVTGASGGIGRATIERLREEGYRVVAVDLDGERPGEVTGQQVVTAPCDITDRESLDELVGWIEAELGPLAIQVNAAGTFHGAPFLEATEEDWNRVLRVNAYGLLASMQAAARVMEPRRRGAIVNLSSAAGRSARADYAAYAASKAAVISLTRSAAAALGPSGLRVNAVAPGVIETAMQDVVRETRRAMGRPEPPSDGGSPLRRTGQAREVADAIVYLASDAASFVNGQTLNVCGGVEMD